jgi:hypothetical protein
MYLIFLRSFPICKTMNLNLCTTHIWEKKSRSQNRPFLLWFSLRHEINPKLRTLRRSGRSVHDDVFKSCVNVYIEPPTSIKEKPTLLNTAKTVVIYPIENFFFFWQISKRVVRSINSEISPAIPSFRFSVMVIL